MTYYSALLGILYLTLVRPSYSLKWMEPTAFSLQQSLENCLPTNNQRLFEELQNIQEPSLSDDKEVQALLKCLVLDLGLWSEKEGFRAKRIAKLFAKHRMTTELVMVIEYCNDKYRNLADTNRWAFEAYRCATVGRIGNWVKEYVKDLYSKKGNRSVVK